MISAAEINICLMRPVNWQLSLKLLVIILPQVDENVEWQFKLDQQDLVEWQDGPKDFELHRISYVCKYSSKCFLPANIIVFLAPLFLYMKLFYIECGKYSLLDC